MIRLVVASIILTVVPLAIATTIPLPSLPALPAAEGAVYLVYALGI